ncbi:hypothetical protein N7495_009555 [Penicillium taxi]|uniref:uncharacterized protein n=1 Tax=Penicillium taxi TaxID=168475 RepID=UPI0025456F70|nr:uncharacterized protein N7495_009555 [Penicillium taxi]KAJ5885045.1 hypothetical protein N7495_009555 [Penicillium taxi]
MDDDYVAQLLANEARDDNDKYAKEGLSAYTSRRPKGNAPKPNTRFLRHLIKETNNHNTALKRKEERESKERMRDLKEPSGLSRKHEMSTREKEHRKYREDRHGRLSRASTPERERSRRHRRRDIHDDKAKEERRDRSEHRRERRSEKSRSDRRDRDRSHSRSRSRSPHSHRSSRRHRSEHHHRRSESTNPHKKHIERCSNAEDDHKSRSSRREHKSPPPSSTRHSRDSGDESDPLEDIVGPLPPRKDQEPIRSRGRGVYKSHSSTMDAHFALDYDPTQDIQRDDEEVSTTQKYSRRPVAGLMTAEDDWDMSLEAIRDRSRWKQKGEERLRAAGINENVIERWKGNAVASKVPVGERGPNDVRWSKKGEDREWDRGKFVDTDGHINVRAAWS